MVYGPAAGDMTCRAPGSGVTCGGSSPNGQTMTYNALRQLAHWQNTPSSPTTQDDFLYDGSGQRVMQYVNVNVSITTTAYLLGGAEESSGGVITKYLGVAGLPSAVRVGSTLSYLVSDGLGSVSEAFDTAGNETAAQLYAPYGTTRYAAGTMPTAKGFTGQRADVTTGLDDYGARYYDASAGQFTSAESVSDGLSAYAYVAGNPETATDPTGHYVCAATGCSNGNAGQGDSSDDGSSSTTPRGHGVCDLGSGFCVPVGVIDYDKSHQKQVACGGPTNPCLKSADQLKNDTAKAVADAGVAGNLFNEASGYLTFIGGLIISAALLMMGSGNVFVYLLAQILLGIGSAFVSLGLTAANIGTAFADEAAYAGAGMSQGVIDQTRANVYGMFGALPVTGGGVAFNTALAGGGYALAEAQLFSGVLSGKLSAGVAVTEATEAAGATVAGGVVLGTAAFALTDVIGTAVMWSIAEDNLNTQDDLINPYES